MATLPDHPSGDRTAAVVARDRLRCGDAGCNIAFQMTGLFLLIYYTDAVGLTPAAAAGIVGFVKLWDAFADIFAGRMVDRTMTRWGKFRPFILWFSLPLLLTNLLCFSVPDFASEGAKIAWGYVTYALLGTLYSLVNIPFGSMAGAMTQEPTERAKLAGARMVGSGVTILILAVVLAPRLKSADDLHVHVPDHGRGLRVHRHGVLPDDVLHRQGGRRA